LPVPTDEGALTARDFFQSEGTGGVEQDVRRTHLTRCLARMVFPARAIQELVGNDVSLSVEGGLTCEEGVRSLGAA